MAVFGLHFVPRGLGSTQCCASLVFYPGNSALCCLATKLIFIEPGNSLPIRLKNRCWKTGRSRGFYRDFGLSRHVLREMAHECLLPGVIKASW